MLNLIHMGHPMGCPYPPTSIVYRATTGKNKNRWLRDYTERRQRGVGFIRRVRIVREQVDAGGAVLEAHAGLIGEHAAPTRLAHDKLEAQIYARARRQRAHRHLDGGIAGGVAARHRAQARLHGVGQQRRPAVGRVKEAHVARRGVAAVDEDGAKDQRVARGNGLVAVGVDQEADRAG